MLLLMFSILFSKVPVAPTMRMCSLIGSPFFLPVGGGTMFSYLMPGRPKYSQNSAKEMVPSPSESKSSNFSPWASARGVNSSINFAISFSRNSPFLPLSKVRNSCRSNSSNWSSSEDRQAATNSRYSQELSLFMSNAAAVLRAVALSMPRLIKAATTSCLSKTPLQSASNLENKRANLLMAVQPTAIFRHRARCIGLLSRQYATDLQSESTSSAVNSLDPELVNH
mmetsp:Transcript_82742/g.208238  ORF Transcript_82742/g.208238 Transcript_82742/m.208238 type:complete len:225 (-) Transcript_82742:1039-1713(-)